MQVQEGQVILVENERITELLPAEEAGKRNLKASGYEEIDLQGKYILPGLINMHVHLAGNGKPQKKQRDNEALVKKIMSNGLTKAIAYNMVCGFAKDELYSGVTTIRTVGGLGDFDTRLRDDIAAGKKPGPRILAANEGISVPGRTYGRLCSYRRRQRGRSAAALRDFEGTKGGSGETYDHRRRAGCEGKGCARRTEDGP